jgi:Flp pilus assembly protein TadD
VIKTHAPSSRLTGRAALRSAALACLTLFLPACQSGTPYGGEQVEAPRPDPALVAFTLAQAADRAGDPRAAVQFYSQAIAEGTPKPEAHVRRGELLLELGAPSEAAAAFRQALAAGIDDPAIHRGYGRALAWLNEPDEALQQIDLALARSPLDVKSMNARGVALDALDRHDDAQAQYRKALTLAPGDLSVQNNLALSYALAGHAEQGIALLEQIHASGASNMQHRQNLALLYGLVGEAGKAEELARADLSAQDAEGNLGVYAAMHHLYGNQTSQPAASRSPDAANASSVEESSQKPWVIELGSFPSVADAADAWQRLRQEDQGTALGNLVHYLEEDGDRRRLIVGPVWGEQAALTICAALKGRTQACEVRPAALAPASAAPSSS